jgi:Fanconi anemia group M protein
MIKDFKPRLYQETIAASCVNYNSLVVLPTGLGKTNIFLMLAAQRLAQYPNSKILLLGPTRPLIEQYKEVFLKYFEVDPKKVAMLTGQISPQKRQKIFTDSKIIVSTPQGLENDIISDKVNLSDVSLLGFDEAHKATGDYSYVWIAKQYQERSNHPRILGLTASPGSDLEKINEICTNLQIENIEVRTDLDLDVKPYIKDIKLHWVKVELPPEFVEIKKYLESCVKSKFEEMKKYGYVMKFAPSKKDLLGMQASLHAQIRQGDKDFNLLKTISLLAEVMKVQHAQELLETQGITPLFRYLDDIRKQSYKTKVKAVQNLSRDVNFRSALIKTQKLHEMDVLHPKMDELQKLVEKRVNAENNTKIIVFNQYRDNAKKIVEELDKIDGVNAKLFVGQAKKNGTGLSQKEQKEMLDAFRKNEFNVVCMTSVGEEGLDIPKVDLVVFYEPIPSTIRHIQRRGRTGRLEKGEVIILMAKSTRDEAYRWSAFHKEKRMHSTLRDLKSKIQLHKKEVQKPLDQTDSSTDKSSFVLYSIATLELTT